MRPDPETLRRLYLTQRKTTRAIGAEYCVSKTEVRRWLIRYGIRRRPSNRGLESRGSAMPTAAELMQLVHCEHLSYAQIGDRFGVDPTAVPYWLEKYGLPKPTLWQTRSKGRMTPLPDLSILKHHYESGLSVECIAEIEGCTPQRIRLAFKKAGIVSRAAGWQQGKRWRCEDGHIVRSSYEMRVDNWLHRHEIAHEIDPPLPWGRNFRGDFLVGETFVEIWGVQNRRSYAERKERKRRKYAEYGLTLLEIHPGDFSAKAKGLWYRKLRKAFVIHAETLPLRLMAVRMF